MLPSLVGRIMAVLHAILHAILRHLTCLIAILHSLSGNLIAKLHSLSGNLIASLHSLVCNLIPNLHSLVCHFVDTLHALVCYVVTKSSTTKPCNRLLGRTNLVWRSFESRRTNVPTQPMAATTAFFPHGIA